MPDKKYLPIFIVLAAVIPITSYSQFPDSALALASQYFHEARAISDSDNGKLWGRKLYGPMVLVDRNTGNAIANEQDSAGQFVPKEDVFIGIVPKSFASNTARYWGGKTWTIILWPMPKDRVERTYLMMHELFHQYQVSAKLPAYSPACNHLDKFEGRLLLKLELEALRKVINEFPHFKKADLANAIAFRRLRYEKYSLADSLEHALEINEGLATYTGFALCNQSLESAKASINKKINEFYSNPTFVRSLGYVTGYVYGFLLSQKDPGWNKAIFANIKLAITTDPGLIYAVLKKHLSFDDQLVKLYDIKLTSSPAQVYDKTQGSGQYDFAAVYALEKSREERRLAIEKENREKFLEKPVLLLPNVNMSFNFDPNEVQVIEGFGPVYPSFVGKAAWGVLTVKKGGVLVKDWMQVFVPLPPEFDSRLRIIKTANWELQLNDGWQITEAERKGDFKVVQK